MGANELEQVTAANAAHVASPQPPPALQVSGTTGCDERPKGLVKLLWLAAGWGFFAVGVVGVLLPGLPTTGPMLFALACFARGSHRLHAWLLDHPIFGPPLRHWREHRIIPIRAKVTAVSMMALSAAYVALGSRLPDWAVLGIVGLILIGMVVVVCFPHRVRTDNGAAPR